jgi:hypothetical protein
MAFTLNGFGTKYYGTRWMLDGTYVTTKWIVLAFVPVIPVGSVRVLHASPNYGSPIYSRQSMTTQPVPLDKGMVTRIYGLLVAVILFFIYVIPALNRLVERI